MATQEQIWAICDELAASGKPVTTVAVRQRLGGSSSSISPAVKAWKARQQAQAEAPLTEPAPEAIAQRLGEVAAEIWVMARDMTQTRHEQGREALEKAPRVEARQDGAAQLAAELVGAKAHIEMLTRMLDDTRAKLMAAQNEAARYRDESIALRARLDALESVLSRIEKRLDGLNEEFFELQQGLI